MTNWHLQDKNGYTCRIIHGDSREALKEFQSQADLIMTSPPYADARKGLYDSINPDDYAEWFEQFHSVFWQALKPHGSLVINIKDKIVNKVRHRYVWQTIQSLNTLGWQSIDDYVWHKKTSMPGRWPSRLRDGWEYIFHLSKTKNPYFNQEEVMIPISPATKIKVDNMKDDYVCETSKTGSGFMRDLRAWKDKKFVAPTNVLHLSPETKNQKHPAVFPVGLPIFFIKLLSKSNDLVIDPFAGSGSTGVAALRTGRNCILIDNKYEYCLIAKERLEKECGMSSARKNNDFCDKNLFAGSIAKHCLSPLHSSRI